MADKRPRMKRPLPVATLLEAVFAGKPAQQRLKEAKAWQFWEQAVGPQIAARATPVSFRDGTLTVRVSGSAWMQQLSLLKPDILRQLNGAIGEPLVKDLFFRQGTVRKMEEEQAVAAVQRRRTLSVAEKQLLEERTAAVADQDLRDAFMALFSSQLAVSPRKENP